MRQRGPGPAPAPAPADPERAASVRSIAEELSAVRGPLLPILHEVVATHGWVTDDDVAVVAEVLNLSRADVHGVVGFYSDFRRTTALGRATTPVWSTVALHRPAEFNKSHIPAFLAGEDPGAYICVYPFVRSLDWYLLPDDERRRMLAEHGMAARDYKDVRANTVPAFALGDYEWVLAFEAPELHRIVDLMRDLRATDARRHVREETPFFTGPRIGVEELVAKLP